MGVIREDIVSIGFDVQNNPFATITSEINGFRAQLGVLTTAETGLKGVGREANVAANNVDSLANSINAPPTNSLAEPIVSAGDAAGTAGNAVTNLTSGLDEAGGSASNTAGAVSGLAGNMEEAADIDLAGGMESLDGATQGSTGSLQGLLSRGKEFAQIALSRAADGLGGAIQDPAGKIKELVGKGKEFAKLALQQAVEKLPPQAQIALKVTGKLLDVGIRLSKVTIKGLVAGVKALAPHAAKAAKAVGNLSLKLGKGVAIGVTTASLAVAGIGGAAVKVGSTFEASMSQVAATMGMTADEANYSNEQYALLANTAKEMGAATKFSASESAEALNYMALAGYSAEQACTALPTVLNLASSGGMELAAASDMITDSMSALGIEATQTNLTEFGDKLAKTAQKSNTSVAELGEAVLTVGGTAKTLAGGTTELNTLLGVIADNGVKGAEGGTALRNIMLSLQAPTDTAAKKMKSLGLEVYDAEGKMRPMNNILNDLNDSMGSMTDQQKQDVISTIFNKNDLKSVNALLANSGDRFDELSGMIDDSAGAMANMAETMNDNLTGRVTEFKSAMEGAGIAIYEALGSSNMKDLVKEASGWITELTKATEAGGLTGLTDAAGGVLAKVIVKTSEMLPQLIDLGVSMIDSLLNGIENNQDSIMAGVASGVTSVISGVTRILPRIITLGASVVKSLVSGIIQNRGEIADGVLGGVATMLTELIGMAPEILTAGILLIASLLQGLEQQMPSILTAGLTAIENLCQGLVQNGPAIIQSGINIVMQLIDGLVAALPTILTTGIQMVIQLAMGLIEAIPQLIAVVPDIVSALITTLMSVNWLQLGLDIIVGIGKGLTQGIVGLFSKGKDAGKEVGDGVVAGLDESTSQLTAAADAATTVATENLQPDTDVLTKYGCQMPDSISAGMTSKVTELEQTAELLGQSTAIALDSSLGGAIDQTGTTVQNGFADMTSNATIFQTEFTGEVDKIDLYQSGVNIMQGLNNGLLSMKSTLMETAQGIANDIKNTINSTLDIHSPSRVMIESGEFTGMGLIKGLENLTGKVVKTSQGIGNSVAVNMSPMRSRYSPDAASISNSRVNNQNNSYAPVFNLTLNGASASDSNERKVKRWVKDVIRESGNGMMRTNPRLQEV